MDTWLVDHQLASRIDSAGAAQRYHSLLNSICLHLCATRILEQQNDEYVRLRAPQELKSRLMVHHTHFDTTIAYIAEEAHLWSKYGTWKMDSGDRRADPLHFMHRYYRLFMWCSDPRYPLLSVVEANYNSVLSIGDSSWAFVFFTRTFETR